MSTIRFLFPPAYAMPFANTALRKLLADIQIEEQNHAEMIYKYKTANGMA